MNTFQKIPNHFVDDDREKLPDALPPDSEVSHGHERQEASGHSSPHMEPVPVDEFAMNPADDSVHRGKNDVVWNPAIDGVLLAPDYKITRGGVLL